jgi:hypothetical protein
MLTEDSLDKLIVRHPHAAWRPIAGETVIVTPIDSYMHTLNDPAAYIWQKADGEVTVRQVVEGMAEEFDVDPETAKQDCLEFINELMDKDMVTLHDPAEENLPRF